MKWDKTTISVTDQGMRYKLITRESVGTLGDGDISNVMRRMSPYLDSFPFPGPTNQLYYRSNAECCQAYAIEMDDITYVKNQRSFIGAHSQTMLAEHFATLNYCIEHGVDKLTPPEIEDNFPGLFVRGMKSSYFVEPSTGRLGHIVANVLGTPKDFVKKMGGHLKSRTVRKKEEQKHIAEAYRQAIMKREFFLQLIVVSDSVGKESLQLMKRKGIGCDRQYWVFDKLRWFARNGAQRDG